MGDLHLDTTPTGGDGRYTITLSEDWKIWGPNGGYLAAIMLRAAGAEARIRRPASISCHFLAVARFEPVELHVRAVQRGRRSESFHVTMTQNERTIVQAIVRTAQEAEGVSHNYAPMPEAPPPETFPSYAEIFADEPEPPYPFWNNIEGKPIVPPEVVRDPQPKDPQLIEWHRFQPTATFDDPFTDAARGLIMIDTLSWPAAAMPYARPLQYMAPNLDVVAYFYEPHPGEWLLSEHTSAIAHDGLIDTSARVWSREGRLVATGSAQLMCLPNPQDLPA